MMNNKIRVFILGVVVLLASGVTTRSEVHGEVKVSRTSYHGWKDALIISNSRAEIIVVPQVTRVMQFRLKGSEGPFWNKAAFAGMEPKWEEGKWMNFGGDKAWPAPQADWPKIAGSGWPPPVAFDSAPSQAEIVKDGVLLLSGVDPHYGIRVRRMITLDAQKPEMKITTTYEKISGDAVKVGVWVITQVTDPQHIYVPYIKTAQQPEGYITQSNDKVPDLKIENNLISLSRSPKLYLKIGTPADTLFSTDGQQALRIAIQREREGEYPDQGSSAEIYTNPDPDKYVELEMLGPLGNMKTGDRKSLTSTYTLMTHDELEKEWKKYQVK